MKILNSLDRFNFNIFRNMNLFFFYMHQVAQETKEYLGNAITLKTFPKIRTDYTRICEPGPFYLGNEEPNFYFHQPVACHEARFMANGIYLLILQLTHKKLKFMSVEEIEDVMNTHLH